MAISLKHKFQSAKSDGGDTSLIRPSNWNDDHDLTLAASRLLGRSAGTAGDAQEVPLGTGLEFSGGNLQVKDEYLKLTGGVMTGAIQDLVISPSGAPTKEAHFDLSGITAGQDRAIRVGDVDGAIGAWEVIDIATVVSITQWIKTGLSAFRELCIKFEIEPDITPQGLGIQTSIDNGATWLSAGYFQQYDVGSGTAAAAGQLTAPSFSTSFGGSVIVGPNGGGNIGEITFFSFNKTKWLRAMGKVGYQLTSSGSQSVVDFFGGQTNTVARNAIRIVGSGPAFSGRIILEGIRG